MTKKLLSWFGVLALLGLAGAAITGLALVKDRVHLVVQDAEGNDAQAQQIAQLRDDVGQVQRDVRALAEALGAGLHQLAEEMVADATARHSETGRWVDRAAQAAQNSTSALAAVRAEQQGLARAVDGLEALVRSMRVATPEPTTGPTPDPTTGPPPATTLAPAAALPEVAAVPGAGAAEPHAAPPAGDPEPPTASPAAVPRKRSAFAFALPSQTFRFDRKQQFELLPRLSRVGFDAKSTLHDFTGVTSKLTGNVQMNLAAPAAGCSGTIRVDAKSLDTGLGGRNDAMREHLATEHHPEIVFQFTGMTVVAVDPTKETVAGTVHGTMTIRGQTRAADMPVALAVDDSKRVHATGEMRLKLSDFGVPVPSQLGMIRMQDEVKVWIALQARALPAGAETAR